MKANELRIGSWIFDAGDEQKCFQVEQICKNNDGFSGYYIVFRNGSFKSSIDSDSIQPIALTPEILEKCGFSKLPHFTIQNIWKKDLGRERVLTVADVGNPNEMIFITEEEPPVVKDIIVARNYDYDGKTYLHHIQNLYFALTGEELEVKL